MSRARLLSVALIVPDYDAALAFFCTVMGFRLTADLNQGRKRWVTVQPPGGGAQLVLAQAEGQQQRAAIGAVSYTHLDVYKRQSRGGASDVNDQIDQ